MAQNTRLGQVIPASRTSQVVIPRIYIPPFPSRRGPQDRRPTPPGTVVPPPATPGVTAPTPPGGTRISSTPPTPGQYPGVQGNNPVTRALSLLRDPRAQAALLSVAQGLAQPRGIGRTGVSNAVDALSSGYNTLSMAQRLRQETERQYREELRKDEEHRQKMKGEEATRKSTEAGIPATEKRAGLIGAQTEAITAGIGQKKRQIDVQERAQTLSENTLDYTKGLDVEKLQLERDKLAQQEQDAKDSLTMREKELKQKGKQISSDAEYKRRAAAAQSISANAAMARAEAAVKQVEMSGDVTERTLAGLEAKLMVDYQQTFYMLPPDVAAQKAQELTTKTMANIRRQYQNGAPVIEGGDGNPVLKSPVTEERTMPDGTIWRIYENGKAERIK